MLSENLGEAKEEHLDGLEALGVTAAACGNTNPGAGSESVEAPTGGRRDSL